MRVQSIINVAVSLLKTITINDIVIFILGLSTLVGILDFVGFLPPQIRKVLRINRADDSLELLRELGVDIDRYKRNNVKFNYPQNLSEESIKDTTDEALKKYTIQRKVNVGRKRKTELPYYIDLIGATCDSENALYFANLLSSFWHTELTNGRSIPQFEFDFVVTPKDGSPILGYEFSKLIEKPFILHESKSRFSGIDNDMRSVFDCEYVPSKGSTALIVDDSTTGGSMVCQVIDDLRKYHYNVHTCLVVFEPQFKNARTRLSEKQVDLISITKTHEKRRKAFEAEFGKSKRNGDGISKYTFSDKEHLNLVFGDSNRIFINFRMGCSCGCTYCYLSQLSERFSVDNRIYSVDEVYELIEHVPEFKVGKDGTLLSFGCYSECWCDETRELTILLICKLAKLGNPMQLSTKMQINIKDLLRVDHELSYQNQLSINISIPTYSFATQFEPRADHPSDRIKILNHINELKYIRFVLYIRPVIDGKTIKDVDYYGSIMEKYKIPCIVGDYFVKMEKLSDENKNDVGEGYLSEMEPKDLNKITEILNKYGSVYRHSTDLYGN